MRATNRKNMREDEFTPPLMRLMRRVLNIPNVPCRAFRLSSFLGLILLLTCSFGCAPSSSTNNGQQNQSDSASKDLPELTEELIRERINDAGVWEVPEENGVGEPISWRFDEDEPKEIAVVEKQMAGERATVILDIKTRTGPNRRNPRSLEGRISTEWQLKTGWALRRWEIVETKNISMKYKNLPKPAEQNSNR